MKLAIIGAGGHGKVIAEVALRVGYIVQDIIFFDDNPNNSFPYNVLTLDSLDSFTSTSFDFIVGIGDNKIREKKFYYLKSLGFNSVSLIDPSAVVSSSATVDEGVIIMPNVTINANATIGLNVILNTSSVIEHDVKIANSVHVAPGAVCTGGVQVGTQSLIGANATILPYTNIGSNVVVAAGSVVTKHIHDDSIYIKP